MKLARRCWSSVDVFGEKQTNKSFKSVSYFFIFFVMNLHTMKNDWRTWSCFVYFHVSSHFSTHYDLASVIRFHFIEIGIETFEFRTFFSKFIWYKFSMKIDSDRFKENIRNTCACEIHTCKLQACEQIFKDLLLVFEGLHGSPVSFDNCWKPFNLINQKRTFRFSFRYRFSSKIHARQSVQMFRYCIIFSWSIWNSEENELLSSSTTTFLGNQEIETSKAQTQNSQRMETASVLSCYEVIGVPFPHWQY